jgi:antitoxin component YwqK of YwqJK toxin-antitoxin module
MGKILLILFLISFQGFLFGQNKMELDSFPDGTPTFYDDGSTTMKTFYHYNNKENKYLSIEDSSKLLSGIIRWSVPKQYCVREYFDSGLEVKEEKIYLNGNIKSILYYSDNKIIDGVYTFYYDNGEREEIVTYLNGKLNGAKVYFYKSKKVSSISNYKDGVLNGLIINFHENGQIAEEIMTKDGEKNGLSISYYETGQKAWEYYYISNFKLGSGGSKLWYPSGNLAWEICYDEKGIRNGIEKAYDDLGNLKYQKEWQNGKVKSKQQFGTLDNLWFPYIVEKHEAKMQNHFDFDDW